MSTYLERLYELLADWLRNTQNVDVDRVIEVVETEDTVYAGYGEYFTESTVDMTWLDNNDVVRFKAFNGKLIDLLTGA